MNAHPTGLSAALNRIDPEQAGWTHMAARRFRDEGLTCRIQSVPEADDGWYMGERLAFRPPPSAAAPLGADAQRLMGVLDTCRATLDLIEKTSGIAAEFRDYGRLDTGLAVINLTRGEERLGEVAVLSPPPQRPPALRRRPVSFECTIARLAMPEAERLGPGDLVIALAGPWQASAGGGSSINTPLAFAARIGRIGQWLPPAINNDGEPGMADSPAKTELTVPVTVRLPDLVVTADQLDSLAEGGTIELGPVAEGLAVVLSVAGRPIGRGEMVRIGDRFAVLLDEPTQSATDAPAEPREEGDN